MTHTVSPLQKNGLKYIWSPEQDEFIKDNASVSVEILCSVLKCGYRVIRGRYEALGIHRDFYYKSKVTRYINLNSGKFYLTIKAAAEDLGVSAPAVFKAVKEKILVRGVAICSEDEWEHSRHTISASDFRHSDYRLSKLQLLAHVDYENVPPEHRLLVEYIQPENKEFSSEGLREVRDICFGKHKTSKKSRKICENKPHSEDNSTQGSSNDVRPSLGNKFPIRDCLSPWCMRFHYGRCCSHTPCHNGYMSAEERRLANI